MHPILKIKKQAKILAKRDGIQLKEALEHMAKEQGFSNWKRYKNSIDTFWYQNCSFLNHWFVNYQEAKAQQKASGGYLLTYKGQYFVSSADYIQALGYNPNDPVWAHIDFDVSQPQALERFFNYYEK